MDAKNFYEKTKKYVIGTLGVAALTMMPYLSTNVYAQPNNCLKSEHKLEEVRVTSNNQVLVTDSLDGVVLGTSEASGLFKQQDGKVTTLYSKNGTPLIVYEDDKKVRVDFTPYLSCDKDGEIIPRFKKDDLGFQLGAYFEVLKDRFVIAEQQKLKVELDAELDKTVKGLENLFGGSKQKIDPNQWGKW